MANITTLTVTRSAKGKYDAVREEANMAFRLEYSVPIAFKQVDFFDVLIAFILANQDEFMEFLTNPSDAKFWRGKSL